MKRWLIFETQVLVKFSYVLFATGFLILVNKNNIRSISWSPQSWPSYHYYY